MSTPLTTSFQSDPMGVIGVALVCVIAVAVLWAFFSDITKEMQVPDTSTLDSLKPATAIVIINVIAKDGSKFGHTFRNVDGKTFNAVLDILDKPEFKGTP